MRRAAARTAAGRELPVLHAGRPTEVDVHGQQLIAGRVLHAVRCCENGCGRDERAAADVAAGSVAQLQARLPRRRDVGRGHLRGRGSSQLERRGLSPAVPATAAGCAPARRPQCAARWSRSAVAQTGRRRSGAGGAAHSPRVPHAAPRRRRRARASHPAAHPSRSRPTTARLPAQARNGAPWRRAAQSARCPHAMRRPQRATAPSALHGPPSRSMGANHAPGARALRCGARVGGCAPPAGACGDRRAVRLCVQLRW
jgi:hypothetical protein